jgi:hypothetical protein
VRSPLVTADRRLLRGLSVLALVAASAAAAWFFGRASAPTAIRADGSGGGVGFDAVERRAVEALKARLTAEPPRLASELVPGRSNAEVFTYIADTSDDPPVIAAALRETLNVYSSRSSQKRAPDAELERVLLKHLRSSEPTVLTAALSAARIPLMMAAPSEAIATAVSESAKPERAASLRAAALETLGLLRPDRRGAQVLAVFEQALGAAEPHLISLALLALSQSGPSLLGLVEGERTRLAARVFELRRHPDPGVRGRSLAVLADVEGLVAADLRFAAGREHLADPHGYVRAQAADLLLRCREPMAIHALIELAGDLAEARYELRGFTTLDGNAGTLLHVVPGRPRVADAALLALLTLSQQLPGVSALVLSLGGRASPEALLVQNGEAARLWYRSEAPRIPRVPRTSDP